MAGRKTFRKVITSPELIEKINPKNKKLFDRFLKNFANTHSPKSVINYRSNLNIFGVWNVLENDNKFFIDFKVIDFLDFFDYCVSELQWSANRYAQMHSSLSSFSAWIERIYYEDYPNYRNLLSRIEKPVKELVRKKSVFQEEEIDKLMNWLGEKNKVQQQCLLALVTSSGARVSELARFTTTLIDENNTAFDDLFLETTEELQIKGRGVNGKNELRYILKDTFLPYYKKWLPIREQIMKKYNKQHNFIFINRYGDPASVATFRGWTENWDNVLEKHLYIHSLRHYFVSYLLKLNVSSDFIKEIIAWKSADMVEVYNDLTLKERKFKGLDKLKFSLENPKTNGAGTTNVDNTNNT